MAQNAIKQQIHELADTLPEDATLEDVMERLYLLAKIRQGREQAANGQTLTHAEAKERLVK